jgi:short-subunit dehydrogenase
MVQVEEKVPVLHPRNLRQVHFSRLKKTSYFAAYKKSIMNIVITGASRGLGKAIAEKFAGDNQQHNIILSARNREPLETTAKALRDQFPRSSIRTFIADLGKKEETIKFGQWVLDNTDNIDVLVNNAGTFIFGSVHDEPDGALEQMINVNLYSAYHLTRVVLPRMMQRKSGHIFNMCSIASLKAYNNGGAYSISKFALLGFSKNLREEMKPFNIKVTAVMPGAAYTDSWAASGIDPMRIMEASDIADMVYASAHLSAQACVEEILVRPQLGDV